MLRFLPTLCLLVLLLLGCRSAPGEGETARPTASPSPLILATGTPTLLPPLPAEPTPSRVTLTIWGPPLFATGAEGAEARLLGEMLVSFQALHPDIQLRYHAKPGEGAASIPEFLRAASAVAPSVLPDLLLIPPSDFQAVAQSQLLLPLGTMVDPGLRPDLFPFATRDTTTEQGWLALPLVVEVEHGVTRAIQRSRMPAMLAELAEPDAPIWLWAGQGVAEGEMSDALLLQLVDAHGAMVEPDALPPPATLEALFTALRVAQERGTLPRQLLALSDEEELYSRLQNGQAQLIESGSRRFLDERTPGSLTYVPLPTLTGQPSSIVDGFLLALTSTEPRQQRAAAQLMNWLMEPTQLAQWGASGWLPARRSVLAAATLEDEGYRQFVTPLLETGWLRPSSTDWQDFARVVQEQFRALMTEQRTPTEVATFLHELYGSGDD